MKELNALEVPELSEAISAYYNVTASSEFREIERLRAKAQHDEAQALHNARREEMYKFARNMLVDGEPIEKIIKYTGLTSQQIESLRDTY